MKLNQIEILCKIIDRGSFSKAAESLNLTQPTLTEHIKSLEEYLGIPLLDRLGREVTPTKAGEILYEYAQKILRLVEQAEQHLRSLQGELKGELAIGASTIPGEFLLPRLFKSFREHFPGILIRLNISDTRKVVEEVRENRLELGVVGAKIESAKLEYIRFIDDELVLVGPAASPWSKEKLVSLEKLKQIPFVLREEGSATRLTMERALKKKGMEGAELKVVALLGSTAAVIEAVKGGLGCSILSRRAVQGELAHGTLRDMKIKGIMITRDFYLVLRRGKARSPMCEAMLGFLLDRSHVDGVDL